MNQNNEDKLFQRWIVGRYEREMTFEEFKKKLKYEPITDLTQKAQTKIESKKTILDKVRNILNKGAV